MRRNQFPPTVFLLLATLALTRYPTIHAAPPRLTVHGSVTVGDELFDGVGHFKLSILSESGDSFETLWSNDPNSTGGAEPEEEFEVPVVRGVYSIVIGADGLPPLDPTIFEQDDLALRIWFSDGVNGFEALTPDQRFNSVPYALTAQSVAPGAISTTQLMDGAVTTAILAPGSVTTDILADSAVSATKVQDGSITAAKLAPDVVEGLVTSELPANPDFAGDTSVGGSLRVGVNATEDSRARLHVEASAPPGNRPENHVAFLKNLNSSPNTNGLAIMLGNAVAGGVDNTNNFITFYDEEDAIAGRVEGVSGLYWELVLKILAELRADIVTALGIYDFSFEVRENRNWFDAGALPSLTLGDDGRNPSLTFDEGRFPEFDFAPGSSPRITFEQGRFPTYSFDAGRAPTAQFNEGEFPPISFDRGSLPDADFSDGELPSLTFSGGSLPSLNGLSLNPGSLPSATLDPGALPDLDFDDGRLPSLSVGDGTPPSLSFNAGQLPSWRLARAGALPSLDVQGGAAPQLTIEPGELPTATLDPGQAPTITLNPGELPSINGLPFEITELGVTVNAELVARLLAEFGGDLDAFKKAWELLSDPICAAILQSQRAFEGSGVTYESGSGDYAEWLPRMEDQSAMKPGDVVGVFGGRISHETEGADQVLVVSYRPIVLGNMPDDEARKALSEKVAFMGQVPVKVVGRVNKGDYLIPSGNADGMARAIAPDALRLEDLDRVIGVAWGESELEVPKYIKVAVGLETRTLASALREKDREIRSLRREITDLKARLRETTQLTNDLSTRLDRFDKLETRLNDALSSIERTNPNTAGERTLTGIE